MDAVQRSLQARGLSASQEQIVETFTHSYIKRWGKISKIESNTIKALVKSLTDAYLLEEPDPDTQVRNAGG